MNEHKQNDICLTATDCFILALENHIHNQGTSGNTCRYVFEIEGDFNVDALKTTLAQNKASQQMASFALHKGLPLSIPKWRAQTNFNIDVNVYKDDNYLPDYILNKIISSTTAPLFCFDILKRSSGNSTLIFSWNHLLMDGYGAVLYLKQLNSKSSNNSYISLSQKTKLSYTLLKEATKAKFFLSRTSKNPTSSISPEQSYQKVHQKIKVISFTKEETDIIDGIAPKMGAKFGRSPYYLACAARGVKSILLNRKQTVSNFWIPVPQNQRKKGAQGPLLGNHLSFLFYRINSENLNTIDAGVKDINEQMVQQVKNGIPKAYDVLMNYLKRIPTSLYYHLIKGPQGNSLSGFLFTLAEDHPNDLLNFLDHKVTNALSFPPNTYPPGLTFAFMRFEGKLQVMLLYYNEVLSETEANQLEEQLKFELATGQNFIKL